MEYENNETKTEYVPRCPTCGCPQIRRLTEKENFADLSFAGSEMSFPELKITRFTGKTFICENCGYTW